MILKKKRIQDGLSLAQAAEQLHVNATTLRRWETGCIKTTTPQRLHQLQLFLLPRQPHLPPELQCILDLYDALHPNYQQKLLREISVSLSQLLSETVSDSEVHSPVR